MSEVEAAWSMVEIWETEHLRPQPGTDWKLTHRPVTSVLMVSFTNVTIAEEIITTSFFDFFSFFTKTSQCLKTLKIN